MEQNGNGLAQHGYTVGELENIRTKLEARNLTCELVKLHDQSVCGLKPGTVEDAAILVIRDAFNALLNAQTDDSDSKDADGDEEMKNEAKRAGSDVSDTHQDMLDEQMRFKWDSKYFDTRRQKVLNKHARHNVCFGAVAQAPDYKNKKGTIVAFDQVPLLSRVYQRLPLFFGSKASNIQAEGNHYYDTRKCGVGFHGDEERKIVIGLRLGTAPLHYQWFTKSKPIGDRVKLSIHGGDMYVMSEKASGFDWKRRSLKTLRHAAGCAKFTTIRKK